MDEQIGIGDILRHLKAQLPDPARNIRARAEDDLRPVLPEPVLELHA